MDLSKTPTLLMIQIILFSYVRTCMYASVCVTVCCIILLESPGNEALLQIGERS